MMQLAKKPIRLILVFVLVFASMLSGYFLFRSETVAIGAAMFGALLGFLAGLFFTLAGFVLWLKNDGFTIVNEKITKISSE